MHSWGKIMLRSFGMVSHGPRLYAGNSLSTGSVLFISGYPASHTELLKKIKIKKK